MKFNVELTDTFGGEANYSWVKQTTIEVPDGASELTIVREAKAAIGLTGVKCEREVYDGEITLRPRKACIVAFITSAE